LSDNDVAHEEGEQEQIEEDIEPNKEDKKTTTCVVGEYIFLIDKKTIRIHQKPRWGRRYAVHMQGTEL